MNFQHRLNAYLDRRLGSEATKHQRAAACGIDYNYFVMIMAGNKAPPSTEMVVQIAKNLKLDKDESASLIALAILSKAKDPDTKSVLEKFINPEPTNGKFVELTETHTIPIYTVIRAGNGEMGITDAETDNDRIYINDDYKKANVFALKVSGTSMEPEIFDGEIGLFKPINGEVRKERDIYAVEVEGWAGWVVKYVKEDPSGIVQLISANPAYPVREIDPKVSRVILRGRLIESRRIRR